MLYERWYQIACAFADQVALRDFAAGQEWTFGQLAAASEQPAGSSAAVFAQGASVDFIFAVLQAWRKGRAICPLEPGQSTPEISGPLPENIVHLKTTSATTGSPRLVAFTASQLMADADNIVAAMGLRREWPNLAVISLAHSYGFSNLVLPLVLHGIPLTLSGAALPEAVRRAAASSEGVTLAAVPALWRSWHEARAIPANVRLAISAGAPLPLALEQSVFAERGLKIHNFYGSSECGGIAYDSTLVPRSDSACVGRTMPNVRTAVGEDGCLEVRGQTVAESYWPEPSPNLGSGVFHTNDLAEIRDGAIYLRGRASDQINVAGRKISPEAIETVLLTHPEVQGCLAFGIPSASGERGEIIVACIGANAGLTSESLRHFATERLPAWQVPRQWWVMDALEVNGRGKLSRAEWRQRYLSKTEQGC
jgi:acyl-CoA synthetase (AMP-forming)/AMP-acid ligase II